MKGTTPAGAETRLKVIVLAGRSGSVAVLVTTNVPSGLMVWLAGTASNGAPSRAGSLRSR